MFVKYEFRDKPEWIDRLENAFVDYFGRERVGIVHSNNISEDCCTNNPYLVVHFPVVDIQRYHRGNHTGHNHVITNLFMFIGLDLSHHSLSSGLNGLRTTYTNIELLCGYSHSHLRSTYRSDCHTLHYFCTGSGPINDTIATLATTRDFNGIDNDFLTMFAFQLDLLVPVESVDGVPYNSITNLGIRRRSHSLLMGIYIGNDTNMNADVKRFIKYLASRNYFKFLRVNNTLLPWKNIVLLERELSKLFIEWLVDSELSAEEIQTMIERYFVECVREGKGFCMYNSSSATQHLRGGVPLDTPIIQLGDTEFKLEINEVREDSEGSSNTRILDGLFLNNIFTYIYHRINRDYGEEDIERSREE